MRRLGVIDAGHGGLDPGAVGNGLREKDITLGVALELRDILELEGYQIIMTRESDIGVPLGARQQFGPAADFFLSIHVNAGGGTGHETWFQQGDPTSRAFAEPVNRALTVQFPALRDRGLKEGSAATRTNWYTFTSRKADALVELAFIDTADFELLKPPMWSAWAHTLADGIVEAAGAPRLTSDELAALSPMVKIVRNVSEYDQKVNRQAANE